MMSKSTDYTFTTSNDITINMPHPHNLQYATPTNQQIFKYIRYLYFALILATILDLCSALKFRTYICVYTKSLPSLQFVTINFTFSLLQVFTRVHNLMFLNICVNLLFGRVILSRVLQVRF